MEIAHCIKSINKIISVNGRDNIRLQVCTRLHLVARGVRCLAMSGGGKIKEALVNDLPDAVVERHCDGNTGLC